MSQRLQSPVRERGHRVAERDPSRSPALSRRGGYSASHVYLGDRPPLKSVHESVFRFYAKNGSEGSEGREIDLLFGWPKRPQSGD